MAIFPIWPLDLRVLSTNLTISPIGGNGATLRVDSFLGQTGVLKWPIRFPFLGIHMNKEWFFSWGEHEFGPFSARELKNLAAIGRLQPGDSVWKTGMVASVLATCVRHLFPAPPIPLLGREVPASVPPVSAQPPPADDVLPVNETLANETTSEIPTSETPPDEATSETPTSELAEDASEDVADEDEAVVETVPPAPLSENQAYSPKNGASTGGSSFVGRASAEQKKKSIVAKVVRGAILLSQDAGRVNFRKKCVKCGYEQPARSTLPIRNGPMRTTFFCPTCRKSQSSELVGSAK